MSEDEIRELAEKLGLEPKRLTLFEPWFDFRNEHLEYRFEYDDGKIYSGRFFITRAEYYSSPTPAAEIIKARTREYLSALAKKIKSEGIDAVT